MQNPLPYSLPFLIALCFGCASFPEYDDSRVFRYNEASDITTLDPAFAKDQSVIWATNQIFNGLVQLDEKMEVRPAIARSWEISSDGRKYTFHLRRDVCFHDDPAFPGGKGRRVVASDFAYSFARIASEKTASPGAWVFNTVDNPEKNEGFSAPDDSTFIIRLTGPFPPFLSLLTMQYCAVVPEEAVVRYGAEFRRNPVGTGPFRVRLWKEGVKLVLVKNPGYFEFAGDDRLPFLDAVAISLVPDRQSSFLEFMKGNLDLMSGIDPTYKDELLTRNGELRPGFASKIRLITQPYLNTEYLGFLVDSGTHADVIPRAVRQAINYSFDRRKMIRYLRNNVGIPGLQGITPAGLPSFDSTRSFYDYDPARAARILRDAGFPEGKGLQPVTLTSTSDYLDICKYVQHQAGAIGIDLRIEIAQPAAVKEMKANARLPFFRASWIADYPDAENYLSMFHSRNFCPRGPNYTRFSSAEFDRLYDKAMITVDDSARYVLYREMERILMEESPVVILYYDQVLRFIQNDVEGLGINPMNLLTLKYVRKKR